LKELVISNIQMFVIYLFFNFWQWQIATKRWTEKVDITQPIDGRGFIEIASQLRLAG
jgi:hypothetical protein